MFATESVTGALEMVVAISRMQLLDDELLIVVTEISDAGSYTCNVSNTIGVVAASAHLTVTSESSLQSPLLSHFDVSRNSLS